jgi:hypothetical protein
MVYNCYAIERNLGEGGSRKIKSKYITETQSPDSEPTAVRGWLLGCRSSRGVTEGDEHQIHRDGSVINKKKKTL